MIIAVRKKISPRLIYTALALCVLGFTVPAQKSEKIDPALELSVQYGQRFSRAVVEASRSGWAKKQVDVLVDLYADDAILFPPKGDPIRGREAIKKYWSRTPDRRIFQHSIQTERAELSGELLMEYGKFSLAARSGSDPVTSITSNFISVWRRGPDGTWRKRLDSWW